MSSTHLPSSALPNPALVTQAATARLPRWILLGLSAIYILAGFLGRQPWKGADISAFGFMRALASGESSWFTPQLLGARPDLDTYLVYWLGAGAIQTLSPWVNAALASRLPFMLLLALTFLATWYAAYHLARLPGAQPVALAFGGEARPVDYARTLADASVLALIACLGLPLISHEAAPALVQLGLSSLLFYSVCAMFSRNAKAAMTLVLSSGGLVLSGAPILAVSWCLAASVLHAMQGTDRHRRWSAILLAAAVACSILGWSWDVIHWRTDFPQSVAQWKDTLKLLVWFTWPCLPVAAWALWRWRRQWLRPVRGFHLAWPVVFIAICLVGTLAHQSAQRHLLLTLPALAVLAAFALPTLKRSITALVDWFTLLFFSGCAIVIWVVWISMQTGFPAKPARNVMKLAPGFVHEFHPVLFVLALAATLAWIVLVVWRIGRNRPALWKSLVLPAGGATLSWVLVMTLWLPLLDFARGYQHQITQVQQALPRGECVKEFGLNTSQITALQYHGGYRLYHFDSEAPCRALVVGKDARIAFDALNLLGHWKLVRIVTKPTSDEALLVYRRDRL